MAKSENKIKEQIIQLAAKGQPTEYIESILGIKEGKLLTKYRRELNIGRSKIWDDLYPEVIDRAKENMEMLKTIMPIANPDLIERQEDNQQSAGTLEVIIKR